MEAIENPLSALEDLKAGTLTSEKVEVLKYMYPNIYTTIQNQVMQKVMGSSKPIPYQKRLQLGILLDVNTDESLKPENIAGLQMILHNNKEQQPQNSQGPKLRAGVKNLSKADRLETDSNKIAQKDQP